MAGRRSWRYSALALRFVPYSDNHGHFDLLWSSVMGLFGILALAASVYLIEVLEILKLRRVRRRQVAGMRALGEAEPPAEQDLDEAVATELETGSFPVIRPDKS